MKPSETRRSPSGGWQSASEAEIGREVSGVVPKSVGHPAMLSVIVPVATTPYPGRTGVRTAWIGLRIAGVLPRVVPAPFPDIARHVVQAVAVGREGAYGSCVWKHIIIEERIIATGRTNIVGVAAIAKIIAVTPPTIAARRSRGMRRDNPPMLIGRKIQMNGALMQFSPRMR